MRRSLAAIGVVRSAGGDALRDDAARGVLAEMDHLGAAVDLLMAVGHGDRVEFSAAVVAAQDAGRVLPGERRAGFDLRPGDLGAGAAARATLGGGVVNPARAFPVARSPGLDGAILDIGIRL